MKNNILSYVIVGILAIVGGFFVISLVQNNHGRDSKLENAAEEVSDGLKNAARELEHERTPGERVGDAFRDLGDNIKDATN